MIEPEKFAVLSHILPPAWSGQSIVLCRLLDGIASDRYCMLTAGETDGRATGNLPAKIWRLPKSTQGYEFLASRLSLLANILVAWQVERRARKIEQILRQENATVLVACSGDLLDIPAGALAARRARIGFVPYFFDDYLYQWTGWRRRVALRLERAALRKAAIAIVPNEFAAVSYHQRYGIACQVVRNPPLKLPGISNGRVKRPGPWRIVYTGTIYHAHYDAFVRLLQALAAMPETAAELHLYTPQPQEELAKHGIVGPSVRFLGVVSQEEALKVQSEADLLFLPLAFFSEISEVLHASAPGKMGEYLASGTPILVHAPEDSFLSWYFTRHQCGCVVNSANWQALRDALEALQADEKMRLTLTAAALRQAHNDFSIDFIRTEFLEALQKAAITQIARKV